jgi:hypothetical protein
VNSLLPVVDAIPEIPGDLRALRKKAAELPYFPTMAFEKRMDSAAAPLDFSVHVPRRPGGADLFYAEPLSQWLTAGSLLAHSVENMILEFDHPFNQVPALFLGLTEVPQPDADTVQSIAGILVPGAQVPARLAEYVTHLAAMPARAPDLLRLNIGGQGIGYIARAGELRASLAPFARNFVCAIDIFNRAEPIFDTARFGLECYTDNWPVLFKECMKRGWCGGADVRELLAWTGESEGPHRSAVPDWSARTGLFLNGSSRILRKLNHVKIVCAAGEPTRMKAYLAAYHVWR